MEEEQASLHGTKTVGTATDAGEELHTRALGFRMTANDLQETLNRLTSGSRVAPEAKLRLLGHFLSITVLRAFAAECMLKAIAFARGCSFQHDHNLSALYEALDGPTRGLIETTADAHGVASPKRVLKRHRNDFVEWRYPTGGEQTTGLLDLDSVLGVLELSVPPDTKW